MKTTINYPIPEYGFQKKQLCMILLAHDLSPTAINEVIEELQEISRQKHAEELQEISRQKHAEYDDE